MSAVFSQPIRATVSLRAYPKNSRATTASTAWPSSFAQRGYRLSTPGGVVAERMIGCSVTTLTKIEMIQKLEKMAHFWMSGIGAMATTRSAKPSASTEAIAGGGKREDESTSAVWFA